MPRNITPARIRSIDGWKWSDELNWLWKCCWLLNFPKGIYSARDYGHIIHINVPGPEPATPQGWPWWHRPWPCHVHGGVPPPGVGDLGKFQLALGRWAPPIGILQATCTYRKTWGKSSWIGGIFVVLCHSSLAVFMLCRENWYNLELEQNLCLYDDSCHMHINTYVSIHIYRIHIYIYLPKDMQFVSSRCSTVGFGPRWKTTLLYPWGWLSPCIPACRCLRYIWFPFVAGSCWCGCQGGDFRWEGRFGNGVQIYVHWESHFWKILTYEVFFVKIIFQRPLVLWRVA